MRNKKVVLIPGFMDVAANYSSVWEGLDIWGEKADWKERIDADIVVGYSLGANFALLNWQKNRNTKLVLINPLVPKRSKAEWAKRWVSFFSAEGLKVNKEHSKVMVWFPLKTKLTSDLLSHDLSRALDMLPKNGAVVLRGARDNFFCDAEAARFIKSKNIPILEVDAGHGWDENMATKANELVERILST